MQLPVSFCTALKTADLLAFIDCGATENFISKKFVEEHKLRTQQLLVPKILHNANGGPNKGGNITYYLDLEVSTGGNIATL